MTVPVVSHSWSEYLWFLSLSKTLFLLPPSTFSTSGLSEELVFHLNLQRGKRKSDKFFPADNNKWWINEGIIYWWLPFATVQICPVWPERQGKFISSSTQGTISFITAPKLLLAHGTCQPNVFVIQCQQRVHFSHFSAGSHWFSCISSDNNTIFPPLRQII